MLGELFCSYCSRLHYEMPLGYRQNQFIQRVPVKRNVMYLDLVKSNYVYTDKNDKHYWKKLWTNSEYCICIFMPSYN